MNNSKYDSEHFDFIDEFDKKYPLSTTERNTTGIEIINNSMHNIDTLAKAVGTEENAERFLKELDRIRTIEKLEKENKKLLDANIDLIQDLSIALDLLEECLYFINNVPNKKYKTKISKDSYQLANSISAYLKQNK